MAKQHNVDAESRVARRAAERNTLPADRFDALEKSPRVGAHRVIGRPRRIWLFLVCAVIGFLLLTIGGVLYLQISGQSVADLRGETSTSTAKPEVKVKAELDPEAQVVVLNGTPMEGFEAVVDSEITQNGWGQILFSGPAAVNNVEISAVFYADPADEAAALGLAKELGGVSTFLNTDYSEYGARLTVLLGTNYAGPGSDQLVY